MRKIKSLVPTEKKRKRSLFRNCEGMSTVEYAILLAVVVAVAFVTWNKFGTKVHKSIQKSATVIDLKI